ISQWRSRSRKTTPEFRFLALLLRIAAMTLAIHYAAFLAAGLLLPKDRTGIFFIPLFVFAFGTVLALRLRSRHNDALARFGLAVLISTAVCFGGALRFGYFREWKFDSDTKQLYL